MKTTTKKNRTARLRRHNALFSRVESSKYFSFSHRFSWWSTFTMGLSYTLIGRMLDSSQRMVGVQIKVVQSSTFSTEIEMTYLYVFELYF